MNDNLYFQCLQLCSGHYLCANYPDNWENLTEEAQLEFVSDNLWQPMENEEPQYVIGYIENAAQVTYEFILSREVKTNE